MAIIPLDRRKAADIVYERMHAMILSKEWKAGTRIPTELVLCQLFDVSRVTIREATHRLAGQGLLSVRQGDGTYVEKISPAKLMKNLLPLIVIDEITLHQTLDFRAMLEVEAAAQAADRRGGDELAFLREVLDEQRKSGRTAEENGLLDQLFHETIAKASGNPLLEAGISLANDIIVRNPEATGYRVLTEDALLYHWLILDAIDHGRRDAAAAAMKTHCQRTT